jgi:hypothetical protein
MKDHEKARLLLLRSENDRLREALRCAAIDLDLAASFLTDAGSPRVEIIQEAHAAAKKALRMRRSAETASAE